MNFITKNYLDGLNPNQLKAVEETNGYVRVVAGAGSGKTKCLSSRCAYLMDQKEVSSEKIVCITFTNKAANEMKSRIKKIVGSQTKLPWISTYHMFCLEILRSHIEYYGYPSSFIVLDKEDQKQIAKTSLQYAGYSFKEIQTQDILNEISEYKKTELKNYTDYIRGISSYPVVDGFDDNLMIKNIIPIYIELQKSQKALDFDDIILLTYQMLKDDKSILKIWQSKVEYMQIDEFQDSDDFQIEISTMLTGKHKNLFIVGDPDQAIYGWRGANPDGFLSFDKKHKQTKTIFLNDNYRSNPNILEASNNVIKHNKLRLDKAMTPNKPIGEPVSIYTGASNDDESKWVCSEINKLISAGENLNDIAILYRSSFLLKCIEQSLIRNNINHKVINGINFFERKEIKDLLSYLRLIIVGDNFSFERVVNYPKRKFGAKKMLYIKEKADAMNLTYWQTLLACKDDFEIKKSDAGKLIDLIDKIKSKKLSISETINLLVDDLDLKAELSENESALENIDQLRDLIRIYELNNPGAAIPDFLRYVSLFVDIGEESPEESVKLMTIHASKGLEFKHIFIIGLSEKILPHAKRIDDEKSLEEERRLMYVAMTRAADTLHLSYAKGHDFYGNSKAPSRFLKETGLAIKEKVSRKKELEKSPEVSYLPFNVKKEVEPFVNDTTFHEGDNVSHPKFGLGQITQIDGEIAVILFEREDVSTKLISLNFPKLKKVD